jgi:hypothetical protein
VIKPLEIRRIAIDAAGWTAIVPIIDCNNIGVETENGTEFMVSTDPNDAAQFLIVRAGMHRMFGCNPGHGAPCFHSADTAFWLKTTGGSDTATLEYYR